MKRKASSFVLALAMGLALFPQPAFAAQTHVSSWLEQGADLGDALSFSEPLTPVRKDGKCGCIDTAGEEAVPLEYDLAADFLQDTAMVVEGGQYALLNAAIGGFADVFISSPYAQAIGWPWCGP